MIGVGDTLPEFSLVGVKPGFNLPEEGGKDAFEELTNASFAGKWKVIYFYPKDFTFVCPTEIVAFAALNDDFDARGAVVIGGSTDNEFCKLAWRRDHADLNKLNQWSFADNGGVFMDALGIRDAGANVALRATFIVDPENVVQHISVNPLSVGRNPEETLRILDAIQTGVNCGCNREVGGEVL
ncbi:MAG: alkyl hydroperoxide reductase [Hyphomicrobiales bacterium]|nr:MAG: alkyl hydroperoxide reductase [Hyphomicrobiales bacterium]